MKNQKALAFLRILRLCIVFIGLIAFFFIPYMVSNKKDTGIRKDLETVYPGAVIGKITSMERSSGSEYTFDILDENDYVIAGGYCLKDGHVTSDTYASLYYADQMRDYFMQTVNPEVNFPDLRIECESNDVGNSLRQVYTEQVRSFEDYLNPENVRFRDLDNAYASVYVWIDDDEAVEGINEILHDADFMMEVYYYDIDSEVQLNIGYYHPDH